MNLWINYCAIQNQTWQDSQCNRTRPAASMTNSKGFSVLQNNSTSDPGPIPATRTRKTIRIIHRICTVLWVASQTRVCAKNKRQRNDNNDCVLRPVGFFPTRTTLGEGFFPKWLVELNHLKTCLGCHHIQIRRPLLARGTKAA